MSSEDAETRRRTRQLIVGADACGARSPLSARISCAVSSLAREIRKRNPGGAGEGVNISLTQRMQRTQRTQRTQRDLNSVAEETFSGEGTEKPSQAFSFAFFAPSRETNLLSKFAPFGECTPGCAGCAQRPACARIPSPSGFCRDSPSAFAAADRARAVNTEERRFPTHHDP